MRCKSLSGADYLLLLLYLNDKKPIYGAIRLTKMMFLFKEEISKALKNKGLESTNMPEFIAYNFGPFSKDVYEQIELFKNIGFIDVCNINAEEDMAEADDWEEQAFIDEMAEQDDDLNKDGKYYKYRIAPIGASFVEKELLNNLTEEHIKLLKAFKNKVTSLTPKKILKYVYSRYPEYTENSIIKHEVLGSE